MASWAHWLPRRQHKLSDEHFQQYRHHRAGPRSPAGPHRRGPRKTARDRQKVGQTLRDLRKAYENLASDLGPELLSIQKTTQELREAVEDIQSIPQDMAKKVIQATEMEETLSELTEIKDSVGQVGKTLAGTGKMLKDPVGSAVGGAKDMLLGKKTDAPDGDKAGAGDAPVEESVEPAATVASVEAAAGPPEKVASEDEPVADEAPLEETVVESIAPPKIGSRLQYIGPEDPGLDDAGLYASPIEDEAEPDDGPDEDLAHD